jgi:hypothetical protein
MGNTVPYEVTSATLVGAEGYGVKASSGKVLKSANSVLCIGVVRVGAAVGGFAEIADPLFAETYAARDTRSAADAIRRLFAQLVGFAGPWLMIPGNHDAALAESVWTCARRIGAVPPNVHLALEPGVLDFAALGFVASAEVAAIQPPAPARMVR